MRTHTVFKIQQCCSYKKYIYIYIWIICSKISIKFFRNVLNGKISVCGVLIKENTIQSHIQASIYCKLIKFLLYDILKKEFCKNEWTYNSFASSKKCRFPNFQQETIVTCIFLYFQELRKAFLDYKCNI